jgi:hypothetical protein
MADNNTNPKPDLKLPEEVIINGVTMKLSETPELMGLVSTIAKIEKSKLYSKIASLEQGLNELKKVEVSPNPVPTNFKAELLGEIKEMIESQIKPLLDKTTSIENRSVDEYRQQLLRENDGKCIPELVKGNTKDELDVALAQSIELRSKYTPQNNNSGAPAHITDPVILARLNASGNNTTQQPAAAQSSNQTQAAPVVQVPNIPVQNPQNAPDIGNMDMDEFEKRRDELRKGIESLV